jgi:hypothetical protein
VGRSHLEISLGVGAPWRVESAHGRELCRPKALLEKPVAAVVNAGLWAAWESKDVVCLLLQNSVILTFVGHELCL